MVSYSLSIEHQLAVVRGWWSAISNYCHKNTTTQKYKHTKTQTQKHTQTKKRTHTHTQTQKGKHIKTQPHKNTNTKNTKTRTHKNTTHKHRIHKHNANATFDHNLNAQYNAISTTKYYTVLYYSVLQNTTKCYSVLQSTTPYYTVLVRTTQYYSVLQSITQYYTVLLRTTKNYTVLLRTRQYYSVLQNTTQYYSVLHSTTPYNKILHSTTIVLQSTTPVLLRTTKYYSSTTKYCTVLLRATKYYTVQGTETSWRCKTQCNCDIHNSICWTLKRPVQCAEQFLNLKSAFRYSFARSTHRILRECSSSKIKMCVSRNQKFTNLRFAIQRRAQKSTGTSRHTKIIVSPQFWMPDDHEVPKKFAG